MQIFFIILSIGYVLTHRYNTYNDEVNSIYGTGDTELDKEYRTECRRICDRCCGGKDIKELICLNEDECKRLNRQLDKHLIKLVIGLYLGILAGTSLIIFGIFYYISKRIYKGANNFRNGLAACILVMFGGLIIPLIVLYSVARYKKTSMTKLLGGSFHKITTNVLVSVKTKLSEREKKYLINDDHNSPDLSIPKHVDTNI